MNAEFKKYMTAYRIGWKILTGVMLGLFVLGIVQLIRGAIDDAVGLCVAIVGFTVSMIPLIYSKLFFDKIQKGQAVQYLMEDFQTAIPMRKNSIRLGNKWIFQRGKCKYVNYMEIRQVYQYIKKVNFVENERSLMWLDSKGTARTLCPLEIGGKSDDEMRQIILMILAKNPNIKIGYR